MAAGEIVYVHWDVGTQYSLAGLTTQETYSVHIQMLVEAGYGYYTTGIEDGMGDNTPFGHQPIKKDLTLSIGADFAQEVSAPMGDTYPSGTTARIIILDGTGTTTLDTWDGVVTASKIEFSAQAVETDLIPDRSRYRLYLTFPTAPPLDMLWYYGQIKREQ